MSAVRVPRCPGEIFERIVAKGIKTDLRQATIELLEYRLMQIKVQKKLTERSIELRCEKCNKLLGNISGKYEVKCSRCGFLNQGINKEFQDDLPPCFDCRPIIFKYCQDTGECCKVFEKYIGTGKVPDN